MTHPSYRDKDQFGRPRPSPLNPDPGWGSSLRARRKRRVVFIFLAVCCIIYLVLHSRLWNDVLVVEESLKPGEPESAKAEPSKDVPTSRNAVPVDPSLKSTDPNLTKLVYNGPIKFLGLYETLSKVQQFNYRLRNKHVVFVASNMNSVSILAGIACEMSTTKKNVVHLALVGRNEISIEFFKKANGMNGDGCGVIIHDARPDLASVSTDDRMGLSLRSAMKYMKDYIMPSVWISDLENEEMWFQKSIIQKAKDMSVTHIALPPNPTSITWFQKLDSVSLSSWHKPTIDIVIHADAHSGQLVRLLKSLRNADYFSATLPRLFIDLDPNTEKSVREFIDGYSWPSKDRLFVRHRVNPRPPLGRDPTSFVESYYPSSPEAAVLFLSPNIELSPFYFQYLYYAILEYKYSNAQSGLDKNLIYGISLDTPLTYLDGETFDPSRVTMPSNSQTEPALSPFLYAAPSTHATLFFGTHWRLLHLYLAKRLDRAYTKKVDYSIPDVSIKPGLIPKWQEHFVELLSAGGYLMLYPNFDPSESMAIYHREHKGRLSKAVGERSIMKTDSLLAQFPNNQLSMWTDLPVLDMAGKKSTIEDVLYGALKYKKSILKNCGGIKKNDGEDDSVDDLFCDVGDVRRDRDRKQRLKEAMEAKQREQEELDARQREQDELDKKNSKKEKELDTEQEPVPDDTNEAVSAEKIQYGDPGVGGGKAIGGQNKPPVIHDKIVSLDDLDAVPVEINGKDVIAKMEDDLSPRKKSPPPVPVEE